MPSLRAVRIPLALALAWPVCVALDVATTRLRLPHRDPSFDLLWQAAALWLVWLLLAFPAAVLLRRVLRRGRTRRPERLASWLLFVGLAPVAAHAVLDAFTGVGGDPTRLRHPLPWALCLLAVGGLAFLLWRFGRGLDLRRALGASLAGIVAASVAALWPIRSEKPPEYDLADDARPNLLLLVWDTARAPSLEPWGHWRPTTPLLDELAEEALLFEESRSVSHFTFTSHLSMLTGLYPFEHGARLLDARYVPERAGPTLALRLREAGYRTGAFVGTGVLSARSGIDAGFEVYDDRVDPPGTETSLWALVHDVQAILAATQPLRRTALGMFLWNDGRPHWIEDFQRPGDEVLEAARAWIESDDPRPWFAFVNLYDVHWPYTPAEHAAERFVEPYDGPVDGFLFRSSDYPRGYDPDAEDDRHLHELYEAELFELDAKVAAFLEGLDLDGSNTAVLVTSDHGEAFGEGGRYEHEDLLEPQVRVPLLLRLPGADPPSGRVAGPTSGVDVAPTLLALAGLDPPEGSSAIDLAAGAPAPDRPTLVDDRDQYDPGFTQAALYRDGWKLVMVRRGRTEEFTLHRLADDPVGLVDLAPEHPEVTAELVELWRTLRPGWPGELLPGGALGDQAALRALGYLGDPAEEPGDL